MKSKAITIQDFNKICRFCAKQSSELKPIFKSDDYGESTALQENASVPFLFQNTLNFDVIIDERLPLFICPACNKKLTNANNFRQQCITTCQFLIGIYENESKGNSDEKSVDEDVIPPTPVTVLIKDEEPTTTTHCIKEELEANNENEIDSNTAPSRDEVNTDETSIKSESKYKGRGRPRKGQEVTKQKRIPKPQPLEMCQICGQLFKCIKTHMFVHDVMPQE
ncbi:hypothetical protein Bhyg_02080 [Pseudolycoriella hygida]|uniref:ZAD domain-containing protein n=1 Tax=Pseudolycoriella hygida TaxID=35572 RepID=A0A9Q0NC01_9DIPT|nr:hypothetical protein Bhyg_02080 [Pseudolycoriella hygida]